MLMLININITDQMLFQSVHLLCRDSYHLGTEIPHRYVIIRLLSYRFTDRKGKDSIISMK